MLDLLVSNPIYFIILVAFLVISIGVREFAHAYVAYKLGDSTPKYQGRVTLNPLAHVDPIGLVLLVIAGFGWGKPVEFDIYNLRNPKRDVLLISLAGPLSNLLIAFVGFVIGSNLGFNIFLNQFIYLNLVLFVFNLIPIHPLDGFKVVTGILPYRLAYTWQDLEKYGFYILLILVITDAFKYIVSPAVAGILSIFNLLI